MIKNLKQNQSVCKLFSALYISNYWEKDCWEQIFVFFYLWVFLLWNGFQWWFSHRRKLRENVPLMLSELNYEEPEQRKKYIFARNRQNNTLVLQAVLFKDTTLCSMFRQVWTSGIKELIGSASLCLILHKKSIFNTFSYIIITTFNVFHWDLMWRTPNIMIT